MRILTIGAAVAGLTLAGGALSARAQSYYYAPPVVPPAGYVVAPTPAAPGYYSYYDADGNLVTGVAASPLGTVLAPAFGTPVRVDRYGPDPNGMIAPDGHRIKCKLRSDWDDYRDHYMTRRICD